MIGAFNETDKAVELAEASSSLCDTYHYKDSLAAVLHFVYCFVLHWKKPIQMFVLPVLYGMDLAKRRGKNQALGFLIEGYMLTALTELVDEMRRYYTVVCEKNLHDTKGISEGCLQFSIKMTSKWDKAESMTMNGEIMQEDVIRERSRTGNNPIVLGIMNYYRLQLQVFFGTDPVEACRTGDEGVIGFGVTYAAGSHITTKFVGIANVLAYRKTKKSKHLKVTKTMRKRLKAWILKGNPNVPHLDNFLQAEIAASRNENGTAANFYREAISSSSRNGFRIDCAFANERCALFYLATIAIYYMTKAIEAFEVIGAHAKVEQLRHTYPDLLTASS